MPSFYVMADGMFLTRDVSGSLAMAALWTEETTTTVIPPGPDDPPGTEPEVVTTRDVFRTPVLGTGDLANEMQPGGRVLLGLRLSPDCGFEASYFGAYDWFESATVGDRTLNNLDPPTEGSLASPFTNFGDPEQVEGLDYNNLAFISDSSNMWNIEWNLRHGLRMPPGCMQASVLFGGRYMNINERFAYRTESLVPEPAGTVNQVLTHVDNDLIGAQLGALMEFHLRENCWADVEIKGAVFKNLAGQDTEYTVTDLSGVGETYFTEAQNDVAVFLGDLSMSFVYQFKPGLTFRAGYQSIWIDGLAVASKNFNADANVLQRGPGVLDHRGKVVYHGPYLGLVAAW
jgi:hypothetical protein